MTVGSEEAWGTLVERDREVAAIDAALTGSTEGRGRFAIVYGQSGVGRSTLLAAAIGRAAEHGIGVLEAYGNELERGYGFGVVRQLLEVRIARLTAAERRSLLSHAGPAAASALGLGPWSEPSPGGGFDQLESLYRVITRLAARTSLLVAVDDLQWCDRASLDFLCFLGHRTMQLPVTVIAAWRRGEPGVKAGRLQALAAMPQTVFLSLAPLSRDGVREVLRHETGSEPCDDVVDVVLRQTGGRPFLVRELADGLRLRGIPVSERDDGAIERVTPESVRRNVVARLGRHAEPVQRLARAVAVLGDGSLGRAAGLAELDRDAARRAADALVRAGLFADDSTVAYSQPILRRAVYDTLSSLGRAELHHAAAALLCDAGSADPGDAVRAARHLLRCEATGEARFADALCLAARHALDDGAVDDARRLYERALAEAGDSPARGSVLLGLAEADIAARDLTAAVVHASESSEIASSPAERAAAILAWAQALAGDAGPPPAVDLLEQCADAFPADERELAFELRASAATLRACAGSALPRDVPRRDVLERLPGGTVAEREMLAAVVHEQVFARGVGAGLVADACRRALSFDPASASGLYVDCAGYLASRAAILADAGELVDDRPDAPSSHAAHLAVRAQLLYARGRLAETPGVAKEALEALETLAPSPLRDGVRRSVLVTLALCGIERGRTEDAVRALEELSANAEPSVEARLLRLVLGLVDGTPAVDVAVEVERDGDALVAPANALAPWAALTHQAAGDDARALIVAEEHLDRARAFGAPSVLGRALAVRGIVDVGEATRRRFMEEAITVLEGGSPLELARSVVELGAALRRAGRRRDSREQLAHGADLARRCGAIVLASRARAELVCAGARPRRAAFTGVDSLTAAERRVAMLAARGLTKREIASELTVSVKTVSGQLGAVYLKLDVHDRTALATVMQGGDRGDLEQGARALT